MKPLKFNDATERKFFAARQDNTLEILAYDVIGATLFGDGVTAKGIAAALDAAGKVDTINLRINSPGGNPFEALAIKNYLASKNIPVNVFIDGEAASAATILMLVGQTITMYEGTMLVLHNAWTIAAGNAADLRKMADDLETISGEMCKLYATRTGLPEDQIQAIMDKETYLTAEQSVAMKFADTVAKKPTRAVAAVAAKSEVSRAKFEHEMSLL
jgi:ATP-dependent Clp protease, protease subunit